MKRKRTFDRKRDAELFEASIRRARQLGQLATEVIGSNATLEEFLVEWWDTYAVTHLRPNTLATYTTLLDNWIVPYLGRKRLREITRQTIDAYAAADPRRRCRRSDGQPRARRPPGRLPPRRRVAAARLEPRRRRPPDRAPAVGDDRRPHARDRRGDPGAARSGATPRSSACWPTKASAPERRTCSLARRARRARAPAQAAPRQARALGPGGLDDEVGSRPRAGTLRARRARTHGALRLPRAA